MYYVDVNTGLSTSCGLTMLSVFCCKYVDFSLHKHLNLMQTCTRFHKQKAESENLF